MQQFYYKVGQVSPNGTSELQKWSDYYRVPQLYYKKERVLRLG